MEKHLLFDPSKDRFDLLTKYGDVYVIQRVKPITEEIEDPPDLGVIHIKPQYENEVYINVRTEVLVIVESEEGFKLEKMTRKEAERNYGYGKGDK